MPRPRGDSLRDSLRGRLSIVPGDITRLAVDAIVNAANNTLLGGGGVDGAIHRAAGPRLLVKCMTLGGCATGSAKITPGYNLSAKWVIHAVGPVWKGGMKGEAELLAGCYRVSLGLAREAGARSVAFPAISTGVYGYPAEPAARVAVRTVAQDLLANESPETVVFACFGEASVAAHERAMAEILETADENGE